MILLVAESVLVGGITGFLSGVLGVGGGFIMIPLLTLIGVPMHTAVGTCLAFVACTSSTALLQHIRQHSIDPVLALTMTAPAILMTFVAARLATLFTPAVLHVLFSLLLACIALLYRLQPLLGSEHTLLAGVPGPIPWYVLHRQRTIGALDYAYDVHLIKAVLGGMATGTLSGLFGIGGGVFLVPMLLLVLRVPLAATAGTSLAVFLLPAMVGSVTHWRLGHVDVTLWIPLVIAGVVGGYAGARCVVYMRPALQTRLFVGLVCAGAVFMLCKGLAEGLRL